VGGRSCAVMLDTVNVGGVAMLVAWSVQRHFLRVQPSHARLYNSAGTVVGCAVECRLHRQTAHLRAGQLGFSSVARCLA